MNQDETVIESGTYRGHEIHATSAGRFIAVIYGIHYILDKLQEVKDMIDNLFKARQN